MVQIFNKNAQDATITTLARFGKIKYLCTADSLPIRDVNTIYEILEKMDIHLMVFIIDLANKKWPIGTYYKEEYINNGIFFMGKENGKYVPIIVDNVESLQKEIIECFDNTIKAQLLRLQKNDENDDFVNYSIIAFNMQSEIERTEKLKKLIDEYRKTKDFILEMGKTSVNVEDIDNDINRMEMEVGSISLRVYNICIEAQNYLKNKPSRGMN
jgi:phage host-nuclease inhibitor protein Gam